jgi:hypothetical protein
MVLAKKYWLTRVQIRQILLAQRSGMSSTREKSANLKGQKDTKIVQNASKNTKYWTKILTWVSRKVEIFTWENTLKPTRTIKKHSSRAKMCTLNRFLQKSIQGSKSKQSKIWGERLKSRQIPRKMSRSNSTTLIRTLNLQLKTMWKLRAFLQYWKVSQSRISPIHKNWVRRSNNR